tara:strand:- start:3224 stop:3652 length:429 start_codon:yes stop_codon:yes gene_type:complete
MTSAVVNFTPSHIDFLNACEYSKEGILTNYGMKEFIFVSVFKQNHLLGILGCRFLHAGLCELYAIPDIVFSKKYNITFHRAVIGMINKLLDKTSFKRMQILVDVDFPEGQKWAKALGFEYEATLKKHSETGLDQFLYVRFKQ